MASQAQKYSLAMSGEFFVAAQLQRLGVAASVTYGNAKRADVVAIGKTSSMAVVIEVKTSSSGSWPMGNRVPMPSQQLWVFVHLPTNTLEAPEYYVVEQTNLHKIFSPGEQAYLARYKAKHGAEYGDKPGVAKATRTGLVAYKDNWHEILCRL
ncbi:hypothetical protein LNV09_14735 [Paucibacter sp. B2R-40]|uniref:hypothetical protein n=1 Tax=Paucibacter sp. B2R-40 TaxID=2893554 RepID=UPI0021E4F8AE|nr:hypothetical protein [Paucibacter sp. B2R-40]MCV2355408.1 hypothetical protein [Paucibacter sp. B2R-40]